MIAISGPALKCRGLAATLMARAYVDDPLPTALNAGLSIRYSRQRATDSPAVPLNATLLRHQVRSNAGDDHLVTFHDAINRVEQLVIAPLTKNPH